MRVRKASGEASRAKTAHEVYSDVAAAFTWFMEGKEIPDGPAFVELYDDLASLLVDLKKYRDAMANWPKAPLESQTPREGSA